MTSRSPETNSFEFVVIAALRTKQLQRGCLQRVSGDHKLTTLAQMEIIAGKVERSPTVVGMIPDPAVSVE